MKVLLVSDLYAPSIGGTERHVEDLARRLVAAGHEAVVATLTPGPPETDAEVPVHRLRGWSTRLVGHRSRPERIFHPPVADPEVVSALARIGRDAGVDLVHGHGWMARSAEPAARRLGVPSVVSLHDYGLRCARMGLVRGDGTPCAGPGPLRCTTCTAQAYGTVRGPVAASVLALGGHWWKGSAAVVANSGPVADDARRHGVPADLLHVIPPWLGPGPDTGAAPLGPAGVFVAYAGAVTRAKGVDVLYRALAGPAPVPLVVMGSRTEDVGPPPPGTEIHPDVDHATVVATLAAAAVVVVPSRYAEPFGLVAVEAMAAGTPVVGTAVGGLAAVLDGAGVAVPPGDPEALRATIGAVLDDPPRAAALARSGSRRAAALDGWPALEELYARIVGSGQEQASPRSLRR